MSRKVIKGSDQAWTDMHTFSSLAIGLGWDDQRVIALCELFLAIRDSVEAEEKAGEDGERH